MQYGIDARMLSGGWLYYLMRKGEKLTPKSKLALVACFKLDGTGALHDGCCVCMCVCAIKSNTANLNLKLFVPLLARLPSLMRVCHFIVYLELWY